jgi:protein-tyrosine phosphatase
MRVLMVCIGNICRSPLAEGTLRQKAKEAELDLVVDSAGTQSYHVGEPPHPNSIKVGRKHGVDISGQRARQFMVEDFDRFDLIYSLAEDIHEDLLALASRKRPDAIKKVSLLMDEVCPGEGRSVKDPYYGPESGYEETYRDCEMAANAIVARLLKEKEKEGK